MKIAKGGRAFPAALIAFGVAALALLVPAAMGTRAPSIFWSPTTDGGTFDYAAVTPGQTASQAFTLGNSGGSASAALKIALSGSDAFSITSDACTGTSLGPKKSCAVTVEYAPTAAGQTDTATFTATGKKAGATASI